MSNYTKKDLKNTIDLLKANLKEGNMLTKEYIHSLLHNDGGLCGAIDFIMYNRVIDRNTEERKRLFLHLKEIVNG